MTRTRMTTRLPDALQAALAARAEANHRSANAELVAILTQALSGTPAQAADLTPYKAAIRRLIDDSADMRDEYRDMDDAVKQAEVLL
jgi:plasmid stability protein